jgi:putative hydrolase of the HAD superfamily
VKISTVVPPIALFLDIGGVLLSNGWDRGMRRLAAETFGFDLDEVDERHHLTSDTYEEDRLTLDQYLERVIFFKERDFSPDEFKAFMFAQSRPFPEMIQLVTRLKADFGLKVAAVSKEGRELTVHRIESFQLANFIDCFVCSCFVFHRKPDETIFRIALDLLQVPAEKTVYIDDRLMFTEVAQGLGIRSIHHVGYESTRGALVSLGLG